LDTQETEGLFKKKTCEGVSFYPIRWIQNRRPRLAGRGRERSSRRSWGRTRWRRHCRRWKLAGVTQPGAMVHDFQNREHRGDARRTANSPRNKIQPQDGPRGVPAMADGEELTRAMKLSATEPHSPNRDYEEDAEGMENSTMSHVRPRKDPWGNRHGRRRRAHRSSRKTAL
jgi:hypothetical protein